MTNERGYRITGKALSDFIGIGTHDGEADEDKLYELLRSSARVTHKKGTRRNGDLIFDVVNGEVKGVHLIKCSFCQDHNKVPVYDECPHCEGYGCSNCGSSGEVRGYIPCQYCN